MTPKIAIIIVTHNGSQYITRCLDSVFRNDYEDRFNVVVVDNGSVDDTAALVKNNFPQVDLIQLPRNLGFAGGNNVGIKKALLSDYDYIVLLNQDTEAADNWLASLVKVAQEKEAGIVQSMLLLGYERSLTNNAGNAMHYLGFGFVKHYREPASLWTNQEPFEIGYASGAAMLIKREVLKNIGAFNQNFFAYHEDLDLGWRARLSGYKIIIAPQAIVYHYYQFHRNKKMFYWTERNRWVCLLQNYSLPTFILLLPMLVAIELMMLIYSLFTGWFLEKLNSYLWILTHLSAIVAKRRQVQSRRLVSDKKILRQMDSRLEFSEVDNFIMRNIVSPAVEWYYKFVCRLI